MLGKLRYSIEKKKFGRIINWNTTFRNIESMPSNVTVFSCVSHESVDMYLLSVTSFVEQFGSTSIEVLNDGSLTETDKGRISSVISGVVITNANEINTYDCPSYISWKRLFRVLQLIETQYVIQLDSDLLTNGDLSEVIQATKDNHGFVISEPDWLEPSDFSVIKSYADKKQCTRVQTLAMRNIAVQSEMSDTGTFLKGCAGFCGYPKNAFTKEKLFELSGITGGSIGIDKWKEWGSEQFATLSLLSMLPESFSLPWPKYQNYAFPKIKDSKDIDGASVIHFIGTHRFIDSRYKDLAKQVLKGGLK